MEDRFIKIINTTYKVLDFFPESDPLKNKAKERVLSILENLTLISNVDGWVSLKNYLSADREKNTLQLLKDIEVLETYLKLGKYQKWIDDINFLILIKEYDKIKNEVEIPKLSVSKLEVVPKIGNNKILIVDKKENNSPIIEKENHTERQAKILSILSEREKARVADIVKEIPNITKRTIRRDLDELLKMGEITRIGEFNNIFYRKSDRTYNPVA